ncbi:MAB_1171c family putative transporter [Actinosynnema sp. NPDC020468]|uniref:MAB_1171c family putative transporter n=1 Tax=Actinosynnema sp. NPDC020468 TaxID=3154488 RepID=UPI0033CB0CC3
MVVESATFACCALVAWLAFGVKVFELRGKRADPALCALVPALGLCGFAFAAAALAADGRVDRWLGAGVVALVSHLLMLCWVLGLLAVLAHWTLPGAAARSTCRVLAVVGLTVVGTQTALFAAGGFRSRFYLVDGPSRVVDLVYLAPCLTVVELAWLVAVVQCGRYARAARGRHLVVGLRIAAIGAGVLLPHGPVRAGVLLAADRARSAWEVGLALWQGVGMSLLLLGITVPALCVRVTASRGWLRDVRDYRALFPLWRDICTALPSIALHPPVAPAVERLVLRDLRHRLYRRVIEIRDGWLVLRSHVDPHTAHEVAASLSTTGLTGPDLQAAVEAAHFHSALVAYTDHRPPAAPEPVRLRTGEDLDGEITWLVRVARAYTDRVGTTSR